MLHFLAKGTHTSTLCCRYYLFGKNEKMATDMIGSSSKLVSVKSISSTWSKFSEFCWQCCNKLACNSTSETVDTSWRDCSTWKHPVQEKHFCKVLFRDGVSMETQVSLEWYIESFPPFHPERVSTSAMRLNGILTQRFWSARASGASYNKTAVFLDLTFS